MTIRYPRLGKLMHPAIQWCTSIAIGLFALSPVHAQESWPTKPLKLVIPFTPGGASDAAGRLLAIEMSERLGQTVVVENMPGGGTAIAAANVARAAPDGYTLLLSPTNQLAILPVIESNLRYDPVKSFTPVALVASSAYIISVSADNPKIHNFADLVAQAKKEQLSYSSCGPTSVCNMTGELMNTSAGVSLMHVPFQGSAPAIFSVLGGHVNVAVDTEAAQSANIRANKLRPLVITADQRSKVLPDVPTAAEVGFPDLISSYWVGVVAPAGTPDDVIEKLNRVVNESVKSVRMNAALNDIGMIPLGGTPEYFTEFTAAELNKWTGIIEKTGMKKN